MQYTGIASTYIISQLDFLMYACCVVCEVQNRTCLYNVDLFHCSKPCRVSGGLSPDVTARQPRFETRTVHLRFVVDKVANGQGFLECCVVCIIPPLFHIYLHLHATITRRTKRRTLRTYKNVCPFSNQGEMYSKVFQR